MNSREPTSLVAAPRRRKSVRRAEILAAAREVFLALPYEQASITQIAERAGCARSTRLWTASISTIWMCMWG